MDNDLSYPIAPYSTQAEGWPLDGQHILAAYDDDRVVVYQAYRAEIADYALEHQRFGGPWSLQRMSWIKPNFLWMMYRSGWATKPGQERVLAVHLARTAFDQILTRAIPSSFQPLLHQSRDLWQREIAESDVRLQWDPDHDPGGGRLPRRAIQLGLRREALAAYASEWLIGIEDVTEFVRKQRGHIMGSWRSLMTPVERVYPVGELSLRDQLGVDELP